MRVSRVESRAENRVSRVKSESPEESHIFCLLEFGFTEVVLVY